MEGDTRTAARTQTITLHIAPKGSLSASDILAPGGPAAIRQLAMDNYSRRNNRHWMIRHREFIRTLDRAKSGGDEPDTLFALGGRFRYFYETWFNRAHMFPGKPWYFAPFQNNVLASNIHRWPVDNMFGLRANNVRGGSQELGSHFYTYGHTAQVREWPAWNDSEALPKRSKSGRYRAAVFGTNDFAVPDSVYPAVDLPLPDLPLASLGCFQHAQISPFPWHPTQAIGQSLPSPFLPLANATSRTQTGEASLWTSNVAHLSSTENADITGFNRLSKQVLLNDLSFEVNQSLWDRFFLSCIPRYGSSSSGSWDAAKPLPNPRLSINPVLSKGGSMAELTDFHRAARSLWLEGGFNIHSTNVTAWKCLLRAFRDMPVPTAAGSASVAGTTAFPGHVPAPGQPVASPSSVVSAGFWRDFRALSDKEIDLLAEQIVIQVRKRAPFCGMADFVNRRLSASGDSLRRDTSLGGTLQSAIDQVSSINEDTSTPEDYRLPTFAAASGFEYGAINYWSDAAITPSPQAYDTFHKTWRGATRLKGSFAASQLTQADILQQLGQVLVARGDTFVVRAYGEAHDASGTVTASAWCEAVVQRTPVPVTPDPATADLNPMPPAEDGTDWGRRFEIVSFRWLSPESI